VPLEFGQSEQAGTIFRNADSSRITIDEIVGFMVTMIGVPVTMYWIVWGFLLFWFFDIIKLPPANLFDERYEERVGA
jgi:phosphatidylglycerophosphatase A